MGETEQGGELDYRDIVDEIGRIKGTRSFIKFLLDAPGALFAWDALPLRSGFMSMRELCPEGDFGFSPDIVTEADRHFPEIPILDEVAIRSGEIGDYVEDHEPIKLPDGTMATEGVVSPRPLRKIPLDTVARLVQNVQAIEACAAVADGDDGPHEFRRIDMDCAADVQFVDTGLWGYHDYAVGAAQRTGVEELYTKAEWQEVREALLARGYSKLLMPTKKVHDTAHPRSPIAVYPAWWDDREIAADVFLTAMDMLFDDPEAAALSRPFTVTHDASGFHVAEGIEPFAAVYREVAMLAEAHQIRLCAWCGRPVLTDRTRGTEALYCSHSCRTKASAARRDRAYELASQGVPLDEVIQEIGPRYEKSIRRWYEECQNLLS